MQILKILSALIFLSMFSCNRPIEEDLLKETENREYILIDNFNSNHPDSLFIEGDKYLFRYFCDKKSKYKYIKKKEPLFLNYVLYFNNQKHPKEKFAKLQIAENKDYLYTNFEIPNNTCFIELHFYDKYLACYHLPSYYFPIYRWKNNRSVIIREANMHKAIRIKDKKEIILAIENEKNNYPENGFIYLVKWLYEKENGLLTKNSIENDYLLIKDSKDINSVQKEFLYFFINFMKGNNKVALKYLEKLSKRNLPEIFNNPICFKCFYIFKSQPYLDNSEIKPILENIILNNPKSYFATRYIDMGMTVLLDIKTRNIVQNKRIASGDYDLVDLLDYSMDMVRKVKNNGESFDDSYNYVDSIKKARVILDSLFDYYYSPLDEKKLEFKQHMLIIKKQMLFSSYLLSYFILEEYTNAIEKSRKLLRQFKTLDPVISDLYYYIAISYEKLNQIDSAIYYMTMSVNLSPSNEYFYKEFKSMVKRNIETKDINITLDSLLSSFEIPKYKLPDDVPPIKIDNFNISLKSNKKPVLIEFFTTSCQPCYENIQFLKKNKFLFDKFDIYLVSPEMPKTVKKYFKENGLDLDYVKNPDELMSFFRASGFPVTVIIDKNGYLIKQFNDTYNQRFVDLIKKVSN